MKKLFLLLLLLFICPCYLFSQSIMLQKGKEFEIETLTNNGPNDSKLFTFYFKVDGKYGVNTSLTCRLVRAITSFTSTMAPEANNFLNTDSLRTFRLKDVGQLLPITLLQQPFKVTVGPRGQLVGITGIDDIIHNAAKKWRLIDNVIDELENNSKEFPVNIIKNMFPLLPEQAIGYQSEWTSNNTSYQITAINGALLYFNAKGLNAWGSDIISKGTFNQTTGLIEQMQTRLAHNVKKGSDSFIYRQKLSYGAGKHMVDTAWLNMAVRTSYPLSATFGNNNSSDSVKVINYFKVNDPVFKNDAVYAVARLNLIQLICGHGGYDLYGQALRNTPTRLLKGDNVHLSNKFGEAIILSADSAFEVCKYLYKNYQFQELVQNNYSQSFLDFNIKDLQSDEGFKKHVAKMKLTEADVKKMLDDIKTKRQVQVIRAHELLNMLHNYKDTLMQQRINPLYLWVTAKADAGNSRLLNKASDSFLQMSDAEMENGNGGRYSLLVYKLLLKAKKDKEADKLLLKTISKLERYTNDTLNKNRYAAQNILAYAYYLKYEAEKKIDTVRALRFLAKAAHYSPEGSKQKAYVSFYDRAFLNSEESYREQFIKKLFGSGSKPQIIKILAENISAEPQSVDEMQQLFRQHYPEDDFKAFLETNVLNTWQMAPAFTLKGIDGKNRSLGDFRNQWLVLDFWGTWCPPCRDEMPEINSFHKDIVNGKFAGVSLLSIACRDKESNVKGYVEKNNFDMPVAMAGGDIEKLYNIPAYPTKVIISPGGRMLLLHYGDDWNGIIRKFSILYPAN
jgi:thiol-disulfide isomerase/thioredoxin